MSLTAVRFESLSLCLPLAGVQDPSDAVVFQSAGSCLLAVMIDPRGQGQMALSTRRLTLAEVARSASSGLAGLFSEIHLAVRKTPGVSVAAARVDPVAGRVEFAGVGRVYGAVAGPHGVEVLVPDQGTLGLGRPKSPSIVSIAWPTGGILALAADGLVDAWDLTQLRHGLATSLDQLSRRLGGYQHRLPEDASLVLVREKA